MLLFWFAAWSIAGAFTGAAETDAVPARPMPAATRAERIIARIVSPPMKKLT
jgi:hypothetical protein